MSDETIFLRIFGDSPTLRVMDFLVVNEDFDYSKAKMYRLNFANPVVKKFRDFYWETTKQQIRSSLDKKPIAADSILV